MVRFKKTTEEKILDLMKKDNMTVFQVVDVIVKVNDFSLKQTADLRVMVSDYILTKWEAPYAN